MEGERLTRRGVLRVAAAGGLVTGFAGTAGARGGRGPPARIVGTASRAAEREARRRADSVRRVLDFGDIGRAVAGRFSDRAAAELRRRDDVRYVEDDGTMHAIEQTLPWGVDRVDADVVHADGETGGDGTDGEGGAHVAIIDTGIDSDHPDLQANLGAGKAFVECKGNPRLCRRPWDDDHNHGTHCAGIADAVDNTEGVVGVSTAATLHAVKVLDKNGSGSFSDVAAGIEYVADQGWEVGSLSLGASSGSQTVKDACTYAYERGVLLVAAAGNDGPCTDCVGYPAAYSEVIAVSSTDADDTLSGFSSTGPEIELAAPGGSIYSTVVGGYDTFSGTSMACPHVSGAGTQLMDNGYTNVEARDQLGTTAEDLGLGSNEQGAGLLDVEAALGTSSDAAPTVSWVTPTDGDEVAGTVTVQIDANDAEDADDSLTVEYRVDGGAWQAASYNATTGYYEDDWDTTTASDGDHALDARATDSAGNASTATITVATENTDDAPAASWANPTDGETVSGTVSIQIDASDDRDGGSDLTVEWQVDDGSWRTATYNSDTGYYEDSWDSTAASDGDHALDARATDTGGNTSAESRITATVDNTSGGPAVEDLSLAEDNGGGSPHADFDAAWSVSDADGDLDTVELTLYELDGSGNRAATEDSASVSIGGDAASGTTGLKAKFDENNGRTYEVELVVTDAAGATASDTATEVEDGA